MKKKLYRSKDNKIVAGIIAGVAEYLDQDPVWLRLLAAFLIVVTGLFPGLFFYILAWMIIPEAPATKVHDVEFSE